MTTGFLTYNSRERKMKKISLLIISVVLSLAAKPYSVEIRDAPIANVIRLLASMNEENVVISGDLSGTVVASFPEIEIADALNSIFESNQLVGIQTSGGVLAVSSRKSQEALGKDLITTHINLNYAQAKDIGNQAKALLFGGKGAVLIDERTNSITIRANQDQTDGIKALIANVDKIDKQVLIEAKIIQASKTFSRDLGIQWGVNSGSGNLTIGGLNTTGASQKNRPLNVNAASSDSTMGIAGTGKFGSTFIDAQISAGEQNGTASVLARPTIVTMNNQSATIQSGTQFYVRTAGSVTIASGSSTSAGATGSPGGDPTGAAGSAAASGASTGSNLQQITTGITLIVTPHITPGNKISLTINVVSSQLNASTVADIPTVANNSATTSVLLENGATTVIGGLAQSSNTHGKGGVPWLSNIPLISPLFGKESNSKIDDELIIFITPTVVKEAVTKMKGFSNKNLNKDNGKN